MHHIRAKVFSLHTDSEVKFTASRVDLVFGYNFQLRTILEVYAQEDSKGKLLNALLKLGQKL